MGPSSEIAGGHWRRRRRNEFRLIAWRGLLLKAAVSRRDEQIARACAIQVGFNREWRVTCAERPGASRMHDRFPGYIGSGKRYEDVKDLAAVRLLEDVLSRQAGS